jgi:hypothetical protein
MFRASLLVQHLYNRLPVVKHKIDSCSGISYTLSCRLIYCSFHPGSYRASPAWSAFAEHYKDLLNRLFGDPVLREAAQQFTGWMFTATK